MDERKEALMELLDISNSDSYVVEESKYEEHCYTMGDKEYLVLTDEEVDKRVSYSIKESLWAFRPSFLSAITGVDQIVFEKLSDLCEEANEPILNLVGGDFDYLVEEATLSDGRGHFLASYDGEELASGDYFIYRIN